MSDDRKQQITGLIDAFNEVRFRKKKDIDRVFAGYGDSLKQFEQPLEVWRTGLADLQSAVESLSAEDLRVGRITPAVERIIEITKRLVETLENVSSAIVHPKLESFQRQLIDDLRKLLGEVEFVLDFYSTRDVSPIDPEAVLKLLEIQIQSSKLSLSARQNALVQLKNQAIRHEAKTVKSTKSHQWSHWGRKLRRLAIFLVLAALPLSNYFVPESQLVILKDAAKIIVWAVSILWFPTVFLRVSSNWRLTSYVLTALLGCLPLLWWTYGLLRAVVIGALLVAIPLGRVLSAEKEEIEREPHQVSKRLYRAVSVALLSVMVVTREPLWFIGLIIWLIFTFIANLSLTYFRPTFDALESLDIRQSGRRIKDRMFYFSLLTTILLLCPGVLGQLDKKFVMDAYQLIGGIALTLIAILLGVQGVIPTITMKAEKGPGYLRELQAMLKATHGLEGFMRTFFAVFLLSLAGFVFGSVYPAEPYLVDLSRAYILGRTSYVLDLINPFVPFTFSTEYTLLFIHTALFSGFLCLVVFSLSQLYYLFVATNTLMIPVKLVLQSTPAIIERIDGPPSSLDESQTAVHANMVANCIKAEIQRRDKLNGHLFRRLGVFPTDPDRFGVIIEAEVPFPGRESLIEMALQVFEASFTAPEVEKVSLVVRSRQGKLGFMKVFQLNVNRREFEFVKTRHEELSVEYKMIQLGAFFWRPAFPEAQIL